MKPLATTRNIFSDLFNLFYPDICLACSQKLLKGETILCFRCESSLPQTGHYTNPENNLVKRFWGRVPVQSAAAFLQFNKQGVVQHLLHQLKYRRRKDAGEYIGKMFGYKLLEQNSIIQKPDLIVPVPLHWKKLKSRGYNQTDPFAQGLAQALNVPWSANALQRHRENISQTKKSRFDRYSNVHGIFSVTNPQQLQNKHILLVDDVVTTGATSESCLQTILTVPGTTVSFAVIAQAIN
jgi:ComF family protein